MGVPAAAVGVDVGGTKIACALVGPTGGIAHRTVLPTPRDDEQLIAAIVGGVRAVLDRASGGVDAGGPVGVPVGVGFPALLTRDGVARYGPNISVREFPLRDRLQAELSRPVTLDNDGNAATWAEFRLGAGAAVTSDLVMFTLGTGVGGGLVVGGRLVHGHNGFAGEVGHLIVDVDGAAGASGLPGEIEAYSSGTAIARLAREVFAAGGFAGTALDGAGPPTGEQVTVAALAGDQAARAVLATAGRYLGIAAASLANCLDPEVIVVGGGAAAAGELVLQPARDAFGAHLFGRDHRPPIPIVPATLGVDAGIIGAGLLALDAEA